MKKVTLCFLLKGDEILLAVKKQSLSGFGAGIGKWNGVGGKVDEGETIRFAAIRELNEEVGVVVKEDNLEEVGNIKFYFKDKPDWSQHVHIFTTKSWEGEPSESEEMRPQWHKRHEIPFDSMWADDKHWLPLVLAGKKIEGEFHFNNDGSKFENLNKRKEKNEALLTKERKNKEATQKALILVKGVPRSVSRARNRLLRKREQVIRRDITIARKEELEADIKTLGLELQELCAHRFIYCRSGYTGDIAHDYENGRPEYRYCIVCGFSEKGKSVKQYDNIGIHFETLAKSDDRIIEEERYIQSEPVDIWDLLGIVLRPLNEMVARALNS